MRKATAMRLAGCLLGVIATVSGVRSVRGQDTRPPFDGRFQPVAVETRPLGVHGPFEMSAQRLAQIAVRPQEDRSVEIEEEVGEESESLCDSDCVVGPPAGPEPIPDLVTPQTPAPTFSFTTKPYVSDPQIAAGSTYLLIALYNQISVFSKAGAKLQSIATIDLFAPLTDSINATLVEPADLDPEIWQIDKYYDMRAIYDPYRKRFWVSGLGINSKTQDAEDDPVIGPARRNVVVAAVSLTEDPRDGWYLYWWSAVVGDYDCAPDCTEIAGADYPSIGISPKYFLQEVGAGKRTGLQNYTHIVVIDADALAQGFCGNCAAFDFSHFMMPDGCVQLKNKLLQPAIHHSDPLGLQLFASTWVYPNPGSSNCAGGETRLNTDPDKYTLVVWAIDANAQVPKVYNLIVPVKPFASGPKKPGYEDVDVDPPIRQADASQPPAGLVTDPNFIRMSNVMNIAMKATYRNGLLYVTWHECASWPQADTCFTAIRLVRVDIFNPPSSSFVDRTFGLRSAIDDGPDDFVYYGVPAVEVNKDGNVAVVYQRSGRTVFPEARYSVYLANGTDILPSRALEAGNFPIGENIADQPRTIGNLDVGGISVDPFDDTAIWMAHGYGTTTNYESGFYALAVGKVFGRTYPDLKPFGISKPASAYAGTTMPVAMNVRNQGDGPSAATTLRVMLVPRYARNGLGAAIPLWEGPLAAINSGDIAAVSFVAPIAPNTPVGSYYVRALVDPDNTVTEYNDDNNAVLSAATILIK